jgi:glc operon protein GlcG
MAPTLSFSPRRRHILRTIQKESMTTETNLGYSEARKAIDAIVAAARKDEKAITVAVSDSHGELVALARMEGAPLQTVTIATNKAWIAAREGKPSGDIGRKSRDPQHAFDIAYYGDPRAVGWNGGIPVKIDGKTVGAVAVSGLSGEEDVRLAEIGIAAIAKG